MNQIKKVNEVNYAFPYIINELVRRSVPQKNIYKFVEDSLSISRSERKMGSSFSSLETEDLFGVRLEENSEISGR